MTHYIKKGLKGNSSSGAKKTKKKRGKKAAATGAPYQDLGAESADEDDDEVAADSSQVRRKNSYIRAGTGRYAEQDLGDCIATEKGLLKREGFQHVQKIIEVYSKALLVKTRLQHLNERRDAFLKKDWKAYADIIMKQQAREIKVFNAATLEVLSEARIQTNVFNKSVELHMITSQDNLLQAAKLSLFTPFRIQTEEFAAIDESESLELLKQAMTAALEIVKSRVILGIVQNESALLVFFDCLMQDYIRESMQMDIEQFRAVIFKNWLLRLQSTSEEKDTPEMQILEEVCVSLYALMEKGAD